MTLNLQTIVGLCAAAGFVIVWLVFPAKNASNSADVDGSRFKPNSSNSQRQQDEDETKSQGSRNKESSTAGSTYSEQRPRWCDILLLEPDASPAAIRKAYSRLMKGLHPDVAGADERTSAQCALVQEAYKQAMRGR